MDYIYESSDHLEVYSGVSSLVVVVVGGVGRENGEDSEDGFEKNNGENYANFWRDEHHTGGSGICCECMIPYLRGG